MSSGHEIALGFSWLYAVLNGDATLMSEAVGGVWRGLAPPSTAVPFVMMAHQAGADKISMNAFRFFSEVMYQVKCVGPASMTATIALAAERIDILLGNATGTTTGGAILYCYREQPLFLDEIVNGEVWSNIGGLYKLAIEQTS